jgi:hypothetical protein
VSWVGDVARPIDLQAGREGSSEGRYWHAQCNDRTAPVLSSAGHRRSRWEDGMVEARSTHVLGVVGDVSEGHSAVKIKALRNVGSYSTDTSSHPTRHEC